MNDDQKQPLGFFESNPILGLLFAAVIAAVVSALVYWISFVLGIRFTDADINNNSEAYAGIVGGVLATSVALGGSIVAIYLAAFAIRLQRRQHARDDMQAQVSLINVLTEQSGHFLKPYNQVMTSVRRMIGTLEANEAVLWKNVQNPRVIDPALVKDFQSVMKDLAGELRQLSRRVVEFSECVNSNPFSNAVFRSSFKGDWLPSTDAAATKKLPLAALQTIARCLDQDAADFKKMATASDQDVWTRLVVARMMSTSCISNHPDVGIDSFTRWFLMFGFLAKSGSTSTTLLQSGQEIRAPLCELIFELAESYSPETFMAGLDSLFSGSSELSGFVGKLGEFAPNPLDPVITQALNNYEHTRPFFRWPPPNKNAGGQAAAPGAVPIVGNPGGPAGLN